MTWVRTRGGRSGRAALVPGVLLALAAGCADVNAPAPVQDEAAVSWMEWPTEIAFPGTSPSVRLVGFRSGCGTFRIDAMVTEYNQVQLRPYEEREENQPCPLYDIIGIFDTVVALPPLPATTPRTPFVLMAPTYDYFGTLSTPVFGTFYLVGIVGDTTRRVGGRAELVADSLGCSWAYALGPFLSGRTMVLDTLMDLGAARRFAFVRGRLLPQSLPRCGQSRALRIESALIEYP